LLFKYIHYSTQNLINSWVNSKSIKTHCFGVAISSSRHESIEINYKILYTLTILIINVRYLFYFFFYIAQPCTRINGAPGICMPKDLCVIITRSNTASSCGSDILNCCPKATDKELYTKPTINRNGLVEEGSLKTKKDPEYGYEPNYYYYLPYLS